MRILTCKLTLFVRDAKLLGFIARCAAAHYRDTQVDLRGVGEKVRKLIDDHIQAEGVEIKVEPISILDVHFDDAVNRHVSDRAKASEMEHALRAHRALRPPHLWIPLEMKAGGAHMGLARPAPTIPMFAAI